MSSFPLKILILYQHGLQPFVRSFLGFTAGTYILKYNESHDLHQF